MTHKKNNNGGQVLFELGLISRSVIGFVVVILTLISVVTKIRDMACDKRHEKVEICLM
jgi:heme/copper-type cytochrome/quinol oxidase subunit 4